MLNSRAVRQPGTSLYINRIVLENFKSYYGLLEIGPLLGTFTSIVGPNGSGKSNLIESMLFVFGKKASWMRLQKIQQLIHNSAEHSDVNKASVEIEFAEPKENEITYFNLKRTVYQTGQSNYEINNQHVTHEQVSQILKAKKVDLKNNRFLVLQGEIEQISMMKPKTGDPDKPGLLEFLEDIIGSNAYIPDIERLEQEYIKLDEVRLAKGQMTLVLEEDVEKLQKGKDKAVKLVQNEIGYYKMLSIQQQIINFKIQLEIKKITEQIAQLDEQFQITAAESKEKTLENQQIVTLYTQAKQKVQTCKRELEKNQIKMDEIQQLDQRTREEMNNLSNLQNKIQNKLGEIKSERNKTINETEDISKDLPNTKKQLEQLKQEKDNLEEQISTLSQQHQQTIRKLVQKKSDLQNFLSEPTLQLNNFNKEIEIAKNQLSDLKLPDVENYKGVQKSLEESLNTIQQFKKIIATLSETLKEIKNRQNVAQEQQKKLKNELRTIEDSMTELQSQIDGNQLQQNQRQEQNATVRAIMDAANNGQLKGVIGRIGDLAQIDKKYDIAVSTACSGFDYILVENQRAAEQCVNFLKSNKIGRYTFICLQQVQKLFSQDQLNQKVNIPPQTERLYDLIKISNPEYASVIYKICGQTLVCENIDIARRLKFDQKVHGRFVTLDGKLIEANGVMSGGGQSQKSGAVKLMGKGANNSTMKIDQKQLEAQLKNLTQSRQQFEQLLLQQDHEYNTLMKDERSVQEKQYQAEQDLRQQINLKEDLEKKIQKNKNLESQIEEIQNQRKKVESVILENQKQVDIIQKKTAKERNELLIIEQQIQESEPKEFKQLKEVLNEQTSKFEKLDNEIKVKQSKLQLNEKKLKTLERNEKSESEGLVNLENKMTILRVDFEKNEKACIELIAYQKIAKTDLENAEQQYKETQQKNQEFTELIAQLREKLQKLKNDRYDVEILGKNKQSELSAGQGKLGQVYENYKELISDYDFLDELDQIESWGVGFDEATQKQKQNLSIIAEEEDSQNESFKKQILSSVDITNLLNKEVNSTLTNDELLQLCPIEKQIAGQGAKFQEQMEVLTQQANVKDIQEFKKKYLEYKGKKNELEECRKQLNETRAQLSELKDIRRNVFMKGYNVIGARLRDTYRYLSNGGDAEFELVDTSCPFSEGILFTIRPKNKTWKTMIKLSGGEKTLASLSLIFGLHQYRPTPFYFFDEVDAALDYKNVGTIANFIQQQAKTAQFIVISLRTHMFECADELVGIYKVSDKSSSLRLPFGDYKVKTQIDQKPYKIDEEIPNEQYAENE